MAIRFKCPHCGVRTSVADQFAGQVASCAQCGRFAIVPHKSGVTCKTTNTDPDVVFIDGTNAKPKILRVYLLVGLALAGLLLVVLLLPALSPCNEAANCMRCSNNLKIIDIALCNYQDHYGCLPPAYTTDNNGRPMHSWRVFLLRELGCNYLYTQYRFDEPWDSPANMVVYRQMPDVYRCPTSQKEDELSNYVVIIGDPDQYPQTAFTPDRGTPLCDVHDGSRTIMVVEVRHGVPWTMPMADLVFDKMTMRINDGPASISSSHEPVANVLYVDGSVHSFTTISPDTLRSLINPTEAAGER